jgi:hypothetical protein
MKAEWYAMQMRNPPYGGFSRDCEAFIYNL